MKQKDVEGAAPRHATKVEVADLRRTLDDFMKTQEAENKSINSKLEKLLKLAEDPSFTSSMASTTSTTTSLSTTEPLQSLPARCSTVDCCQNERTQELLAAVPSPSSITNTFTTAPAKCSTDWDSQDKNVLSARTVVLRKEEELHKESSTLIQAHVVLDDMHQSYISNFTHANSIDAVLPYLATRVCDAERVFEKKSE
jgi:hypothetical protein